MTVKSINVIVAHDDTVEGPWITQYITHSSDIVVDEVLGSLTPGSDALHHAESDALVVACGGESGAAVGLIEWWVGHYPDRPVVVLCDSSANGFVGRAFAAGADDLVILDPGPHVSEASANQVAFALHKAVVRKATPGEGDTSLATMICVLGPKGGIGKTMVACNLALTLLDRGKRVVLVDLDLQFGDVALSLGLRPERTIYDLATSGGSLDANKVDAFLISHHSGLRVLAAPIRPDQTGAVSTEFMADVITVLRGEHEYIVIDTPPSFSPEVIAAVDASSYVVMVGMLDALSLKNAKLGLETLDLMGYPSERVRVVLNRANTSVGITSRDVANILERSPEVLIPSSRDITTSVNEGNPIVLSQKRSDAARSFGALADLFSKAAPVAAPRNRRGLIRIGRRQGKNGTT
jgi:pilus assembly protein CpaE